MGIGATLVPFAQSTAFSALDDVSVLDTLASWYVPVGFATQQLQLYLTSRGRVQQTPEVGWVAVAVSYLDTASFPAQRLSSLMKPGSANWSPQPTRFSMCPGGSLLVRMPDRMSFSRVSACSHSLFLAS